MFLSFNYIPLYLIIVKLCDPFLPQEIQNYKRNAKCMHKMLHQEGVPEPINF